MIMSVVVDEVWEWGRKDKAQVSVWGSKSQETWFCFNNHGRNFFLALTPLHVVLAADIPPSPGNIPTTHPLMVRHADHSSLTLGSGSSTTRLTQGIGRSQRTLRQLTANTGHTIHVHYPGNRQPNPPLILQRWVEKIVGLTGLQHRLDLGEAVHHLMVLSHVQIMYLSHFFVGYMCRLLEEYLIV